MSILAYRETEERLLSLSRYTATLVTAAELNELQTPEDMEKPLFAELQQRLIDFADANNILYAYYLRNNDDGMAQFIIDNDLTEDTVNLATEPIEWEEKAIQALNGTAAVTELEHYSEGYEHLISAFAPVYDDDGNVVAVAGVDIDDKQILNIRTTLDTLAFMLPVGLITVIACGLINILLHNRSDKARLKALQQALLASEAKTSFLANMSHEMRTPLNAIIGLSELSLGSGELDGESSSNLEKISNAGMTLLSTVNDILDISKIEAGKLELVPIEYDIPSLLNDTITQSIMRKGEKPIQFILDIHETLPTRLYGDDLRVRQIINNLLSNAFKYTM